MKKRYLLLFISGTLAISCQKDLKNEHLSMNPPANSRVVTAAVTGEEKVKMLTAMSDDSLFLNYMTTLIAVQKHYAKLLLNSPSFNFSLNTSSKKPTSNQEIIDRLRAAGLQNPEALLSKVEEAKVKLRILYNKYPAFSISLSDEEKTTFYRAAIDKLQL